MHNCSGVRSNDSGCMRTFATCMPLMMLVTLLIISGRRVLFSESTVLPEFPEVVLMAEPSAQEWTFDEDDVDERDIIVNHSGWSRPFMADHAELAWSEQTQLDAARARRNRKCVRRTLSSHFDRWTHRRIVAHVDDCQGGSVDRREEGSGLLSVEVTVQESLDKASGDSVSDGGDEEGIALLEEVTMEECVGDGPGGYISSGEDRDSTALLSDEVTVQEVTVNMEWDGCVVEDDDWQYWGVAKYRHDDSKCYIRYDRCSWPRWGKEVTVRVGEEKTVKDDDMAGGILCLRLGGEGENFEIRRCGQPPANQFTLRKGGGSGEEEGKEKLQEHNGREKKCREEMSGDKRSAVLKKRRMQDNVQTEEVKAAAFKNLKTIRCSRPEEDKAAVLEKLRTRAALDGDTLLN